MKIMNSHGKLIQSNKTKIFENNQFVYEFINKVS